MDQAVLDGIQHLKLSKDEEEDFTISTINKSDLLEECALSLFGRLLAERHQNLRALKSTLWDFLPCSKFLFLLLRQEIVPHYLSQRYWKPVVTLCYVSLEQLFLYYQQFITPIQCTWQYGSEFSNPTRPEKYLTQTWFFLPEAKRVDLWPDST